MNQRRINRAVGQQDTEPVAALNTGASQRRAQMGSVVVKLAVGERDVTCYVGVLVRLYVCGGRQPVLHGDLRKVVNEGDR